MRTYFRPEFEEFKYDFMDVIVTSGETFSLDTGTDTESTGGDGWSDFY